MLTTQKQVRDQFWELFPDFQPHRRARKRQNDYNATIRTAFVDWLDGANREGRLSDELAGEVTLG